jgi:hypothetical protein
LNTAVREVQRRRNFPDAVPRSAKLGGSGTRYLQEANGNRLAPNLTRGADHWQYESGDAHLNG